MYFEYPMNDLKKFYLMVAVAPFTPPPLFSCTFRTVIFEMSRFHLTYIYMFPETLFPGSTPARI